MADEWMWRNLIQSMRMCVLACVHNRGHYNTNGLTTDQFHLSAPLLFSVQVELRGVCVGIGMCRLTNLRTGVCIFELY